MKTLSTSIVALLIAASPALATTVTMEFDEQSTNYGAFSDDIGDSAAVDVTNRSRVGYGNTGELKSSLSAWVNTGYGGLTDVAISYDPTGIAELAFDIDAGFVMNIVSFDMASWGSNTRDAAFRIFDAAWNQVWEWNGDAAGTQTVLPGVALTGGGYFQWGPDYNIAVDNFVYTVTEHQPASSANVPNRQSAPVPTPLPAGLPMLIGALGSIAFLRRRHKG